MKSTYDIFEYLYENRYKVALAGGALVAACLYVVFSPFGGQVIKAAPGDDGAYAYSVPFFTGGALYPRPAAEVIALLRRRLSERPSDAELVLALADAYARAGRTTDEVMLLEKSLGRFPPAERERMMRRLLSVGAAAGVGPIGPAGLRRLRDLMVAWPDSLVLARARVESLASAGLKSEAVSACDSFAERFPAAKVFFLRKKLELMEAAGLSPADASCVELLTRCPSLAMLDFVARRLSEGGYDPAKRPADEWRTLPAAARMLYVHLLVERGAVRAAERVVFEWILSPSQGVGERASSSSELLFEGQALCDVGLWEPAIRRYFRSLVEEAGLEEGRIDTPLLKIAEWLRLAPGSQLRGVSLPLLRADLASLPSPPPGVRRGRGGAASDSSPRALCGAALVRYVEETPSIVAGREDPVIAAELFEAMRRTLVGSDRGRKWLMRLCSLWSERFPEDEASSSLFLAFSVKKGDLRRACDLLSRWLPRAYRSDAMVHRFELAAAFADPVTLERLCALVEDVVPLPWRAPYMRALVKRAAKTGSWDLWRTLSERYYYLDYSIAMGYLERLAAQGRLAILKEYASRMCRSSDPVAARAFFRLQRDIESLRTEKERSSR